MITIKKTLNGKYQAIIPFGINERGKKILKHITRITLNECRQDALEIEQVYRKGGGKSGQYY